MDSPLGAAAQETRYDAKKSMVREDNVAHASTRVAVASRSWLHSHQARRAAAKKQSFFAHASLLQRCSSSLRRYPMDEKMISR